MAIFLDLLSTRIILHAMKELCYSAGVEIYETEQQNDKLLSNESEL